MKVSFIIPALVASVIPAIGHPAVIQAVESMLNAGKQIGDGESSVKNSPSDMTTDVVLTITTRQTFGVVSAFKAWTQDVVKVDAKAVKLGAAPLTLAKVPDKFQGQAIGDWVTRLVSNATAQAEQAAKDKEAADAKAAQEAQAAIEATKLHVAAKGKGKAAKLQTA